MTTIGDTVRSRWRRLLDGGAERGSGGGMSLMLVIASFAMLVIVGLVVDGGAKAAGLDQAARLAGEAARSALQAADLAPGQIPGPVASAAVDTYLTTDGTATAWSTRVNGNTVIVTVTITRPTTLLRLMLVDSWTVTVTGRADGIYGTYPS
jgi:Flp pilus assembly protein TadG